MLTHNTNGKMTKRTRDAAKRLEKGICSLTSRKLSHGSGKRNCQESAVHYRRSPSNPWRRRAPGCSAWLGRTEDKPISLPGKLGRLSDGRAVKPLHQPCT